MQKPITLLEVAVLEFISRGRAITAAVTTVLFGSSASVAGQCATRRISRAKAAMFNSGTGEPTGPNGEKFTRATDELRPLRESGPFLSITETIKGGKDLLDLLARHDAAADSFRWRYYTISRTWHEKQHGGLGGGEYGEQWFKLLEGNLKFPRALGLDDFGNLHAYAFFSMWRSLRAITGNDIDPDASAEPSHPGKLYILSYHWPPNDHSFVAYRLVDLGLDPNKA